MPDSQTFEILTRFLERYGDDVEGRALVEPTGDTRDKIERLARGTLPETERTELFAVLNRNPDWIGWLAREVKALRDASAGTSEPAE
jgi:hypothetical protein